VLGCDLIQGYYLSRPVPPAEARAFLAATLVRQSPPLRRHSWAADPA
jgi:hypothetical protein